MVTIYDLLEVNENASKEEIEKSYQKLLLEYQTNPILTVEENKQNEIILNKMKLAYEIIMDDEKRKKYDNNLAQKRAEELIKNIPENQYEKEINNEEEIKKVQENKEENKNKNELDNENYYDIPMVKNTREKIEEDDDIELTKEEKKKIRKEAQKEFKANLKKVQKAEKEYNDAYNEAYNQYLKKMGYNVKEPWTLKRIRNLVIAIFVIIIVCIIAWAIPPVRSLLNDIYKNNFIIKSLVDIVIIIIDGIKDLFK